MAPSKFASSWKKPYTSIYNDNYLFGFNFYEDMMTWLDKRGAGTQEPAPSLPSVPETAFRKFARKKTGGPTPEEEMAAAVKRTQDRIERMVPRSRSRAEGRRGAALRKVRSVGAFTTKAIADIEEEMRTEAMASQDDLLLSRRRRRTPLEYDRELQAQSLSDRRIKIEEDDVEVDDRLKSVGLRLTHAMQRSERVLAESYNEESSYTRDNRRLEELMSPLPPSPQPHSVPCCPSEWELKCKQYQIEIEQLNSRLVEAESKLKTEITRIKKKFQVQITELEMSLDVANKNNIELQKTIKRQALQITDLQNHYDEVQRQLQSTIDQYGVAQRRAQALQAELDELRGSLEAALRAKRAAEQQYEEAHSRVNELTTINVNISAAKSKLEGELSALQADFDEFHKELKLADERANKAQSELKHTVDILHEEQERIVKIETIRKTLEIEVKTLTTRLEEVEANALVGGKRVISKLEARIRDIEMEFEEEKRRHAETIKVLRKKERHVKELYIQSEESQKTVTLLTDQVEKLNEKVKMYKRQLNEQEGMSNQNLQRVRRFQRELEAAEDRAEHAESNLSFIRAKHRSWVTSSQVPGATKQVYVVEEHRHEGF